MGPFLEQPRTSCIMSTASIDTRVSSAAAAPNMSLQTSCEQPCLQLAGVPGRHAAGSAWPTALSMPAIHDMQQLTMVSGACQQHMLLTTGDLDQMRNLDHGWFCSRLQGCAPPDHICDLIGYSQCGPVAVPDIALGEDVAVVAALLEHSQAACVVVACTAAASASVTAPAIGDGHVCMPDRLPMPLCPEHGKCQQQQLQGQTLCASCAVAHTSVFDTVRGCILRTHAAWKPFMSAVSSHAHLLRCRPQSPPDRSQGPCQIRPGCSL